MKGRKQKKTKKNTVILRGFSSLAHRCSGVHKEIDKMRVALKHCVSSIPSNAVHFWSASAGWRTRTRTICCSPNSNRRTLLVPWLERRCGPQARRPRPRTQRPTRPARYADADAFPSSRLVLYVRKLNCRTTLSNYFYPFDLDLRVRFRQTMFRQSHFRHNQFENVPHHIFSTMIHDLPS